jgi:hypothetical protein
VSFLQSRRPDADRFSNCWLAGLLRVGALVLPL